MIYCYQAEDGEVVDRQFPMGEQPKTVRLRDGRVAVRSFQAEGRSISTNPGNYPYESDSLGVHPSQVKEAYAASLKAGVKTEYNPRTGNPILRDKHHRRALALSLDMGDRNAGWSDPV